MSDLIELSGLNLTYNGAASQPVTALQDLSLTVSPGELVCLIGPSGCGKSTLLNLIAGFLTPTSGRVQVGGQPVTAPGPDRAMVFQDPALFPWLTVAGNIEFVLRMQGQGRREREQARERLVKLVGLEEFERAHPHELSGGMRQRVAIARALALQPRVLLMDEPFGALDAQTRERLQDELLQLWQETGTTILFVTHSVEEAAYLGDRVIVLSERPGTVREEVVVGVARPRSRVEADICNLKHHLFDLLPGASADSHSKPCCSCER